MVRSSARIFTGGARDSSPLPSARKCGQGKPFPSQMCAGQSSVRGNPMCGQDVRGSSYRARRSAKHSSPQQQQQLVASAARLRDPIICAGPDMSDTEMNVSRTRLSAFDWTSTIRKLGSILALVPAQLDGCWENWLHLTSSVSCAVYSPMIRIEPIEDAFTSCSICLDHPSSKLHIYRNSLFCGWFCTISSSNGS